MAIYTDVVLQQRKTHHDVGHPLTTRRVRDLLHVLHEAGMLRNSGTGRISLVSLSIMTAVPTPQFGWQPQETWPIRLWTMH